MRRKRNMKHALWGLVIALSLAAPSFAQTTPATGTIALKQIGEGSGSTTSYFTCYIWVTLTDDDGATHAVLLEISETPSFRGAWLIDGPIRTPYGVTSFNWLPSGNTGVIVAHLHNGSEPITDIQIDSLSYVTTKPCGSCNPQTSFKSMTGTYSYTQD
jgi:hypothetical protein